MRCSRGQWRRLRRGPLFPGSMLPTTSLRTDFRTSPGWSTLSLGLLGSSWTSKLRKGQSWYAQITCIVFLCLQSTIWFHACDIWALAIGLPDVGLISFFPAPRFLISMLQSPVWSIWNPRNWKLLTRGKPGWGRWKSSRFPLSWYALKTAWGAMETWARQWSASSGKCDLLCYVVIKGCISNSRLKHYPINLIFPHDPLAARPISLFFDGRLMGQSDECDNICFGLRNRWYNLLRMHTLFLRERIWAAMQVHMFCFSIVILTMVVNVGWWSWQRFYFSLCSCLGMVGTAFLPCRCLWNTCCWEMRRQRWIWTLWFWTKWEFLGRWVLTDHTDVPLTPFLIG